MNIISKDIIVNSFKSTGISIKLDGRENNLVTKHEILTEEIYSPESLIDDEEDNYSIKNNEKLKIKNRK